MGLHAIEINQSAIDSWCFSFDRSYDNDKMPHCEVMVNKLVARTVTAILKSILKCVVFCQIKLRLKVNELKNIFQVLWKYWKETITIYAP